MSKHAWGSWRSLVANGRIRRGRSKPRRERLLVRKALRASGFRYREFVPVLNPLYHGKKGDFEVGMSWLDFCVWTGDKMFVILFDFLPMHGPKPYERQALESKKLFLEQRGVPYLVVPRTDTSQAYEVRIRNFARKEHP